MGYQGTASLWSESADILAKKGARITEKQLRESTLQKNSSRIHLLFHQTASKANIQKFTHTQESDKQRKNITQVLAGQEKKQLQLQIKSPIQLPGNVPSLYWYLKQPFLQFLLLHENMNRRHLQWHDTPSSTTKWE